MRCPWLGAHLRQLLSGWSRTELSLDAGVVVSELVTNSVAASAELRLAAVPVLVWLGSDSRCLLLAVDDHLSWSAWWDKQYGLWRVAEDDPDSDLYAESRDADVVIRYMRSHTRDAGRLRRS